MLNLPQQTLNKIREKLMRRQKEVEEDLELIEKDDPISVDAVAEASEPGTESWQAEVHGRILSLKGDLTALSKRITSSLLKLKQGSYGKCESCSKEIEMARLEAMPTATLCLVCSKRKK